MCLSPPLTNTLTAAEVQTVYSLSAVTCNMHAFLTEINCELHCQEPFQEEIQHHYFVWKMYRNGAVQVKQSIHVFVSLFLACFCLYYICNMYADQTILIKCTFVSDIMTPCD